MSPIRNLVQRAAATASIYDLAELAEAAKAVDIERTEKLLALGEAALALAAAPRWRPSISGEDEVLRRQAVATYEAALRAALEAAP